MLKTGLFSATVAAFIIESYKQLSPDPGDTANALLTQLSVQHVNISNGIPLPALRNDGAIMGDVVPLAKLRTLVDLVPRFGAEADTRLTKETALEYSSEFWLNKYFFLCLKMILGYVSSPRFLNSQFGDQDIPVFGCSCLQARPYFTAVSVQDHLSATQCCIQPYPRTLSFKAPDM